MISTLICKLVIVAVALSLVESAPNREGNCVCSGFTWVRFGVLIGECLTKSGGETVPLCYLTQNSVSTCSDANPSQTFVGKWTSNNGCISSDFQTATRKFQALEHDHDNVVLNSVLVGAEAIAFDWKFGGIRSQSLIYIWINIFQFSVFCESIW